jgi:hypothetical protein
MGTAEPARPNKANIRHAGTHVDHATIRCGCLAGMAERAAGNAPAGVMSEEPSGMRLPASVTPLLPAEAPAYDATAA